MRSATPVTPSSAPKKRRFSSTDSSVYNAAAWVMYPIAPAATAARGVIPSSLISPASGRMSAASARMKVVLPDPFGPSSP